MATSFTTLMLLAASLISFASAFTLEQKRPMIKFPDSFQIGISTNDPGLNITEIIYYDQKQLKIRSQIFYSILGLEPTKVLDLVLDEKQGIVAVQTDNDCRKTNFSNSLLPVHLFFTLFNTLTDYEGLDHDGLQQYKLKQFDSSSTAPKFYFLFDENNTFTRSRIQQDGVGQYDFDAVLRLEGKTFLMEDWYTQPECLYIEDTILEESGELASFMYNLIMQLMGTEDDIMTFLGISPEIAPMFSKYQDDDEFDESE